MNLLKEEIAILSPSIIICPTSNLDDYNYPLYDLLGDYEEQVLQQDFLYQKDATRLFPISHLLCALTHKENGMRIWTKSNKLYRNMY